jgi:hypothetical protein
MTMCAALPTTHTHSSLGAALLAYCGSPLNIPSVQVMALQEQHQANPVSATMGTSSRDSLSCCCPCTARTAVRLLTDSSPRDRINSRAHTHKPPHTQNPPPQTHSQNPRTHSTFAPSHVRPQPFTYLQHDLALKGSEHQLRCAHAVGGAQAQLARPVATPRKHLPMPRQGKCVVRSARHLQA